MFTLDELESVIPVVRASVPPTLQYAWPLLRAHTGVDVIVKHENHTPIGAFKVRGGLVHLDRAKRERPQLQGIISATRGNHGQSLAFAGKRVGLSVTIVVPHGNSTEKNAAMRALGAELIEHGRDFDEAREHAVDLATDRGLEIRPPRSTGIRAWGRNLCLRTFHSVELLDTVYVPIGLGSGICGLIGARNLLSPRTRIVGVVAERANSYKLSLAAGAVVPTNSALTFADGMAVRVPDATAFDIIRGGTSESSRCRTTRSPMPSASCSALHIIALKVPERRPSPR